LENLLGFPGNFCSAIFSDLNSFVVIMMGVIAKLTQWSVFFSSAQSFGGGGGNATE